MFSVEQAFVGRDEKRAPLKTPAWEAMISGDKCISKRPNYEPISKLIRNADIYLSLFAGGKLTLVNLISGVRKAFDIMGCIIRGNSGRKLMRNS